MELGCGRGGDISKWRDAGVRRVVALDLSAEQLEEARRRAQSGGGSRATAVILTGESATASDVVKKKAK